MAQHSVRQTSRTCTSPACRPSQGDGRHAACPPDLPPRDPAVRGSSEGSCHTGRIWMCPDHACPGLFLVSICAGPGHPSLAFVPDTGFLSQTGFACGRPAGLAEALPSQSSFLPSVLAQEPDLRHGQLSLPTPPRCPTRVSPRNLLDASRILGACLQFIGGGGEDEEE